MTQRNLGEALLRLDGTDLAGAADPRLQAWKILEQDRRRVRRLAVLSIGLWLLASVGAVVIAVSGGLAFPRIAHHLGQSAAEKAAVPDAALRALAQMTAVHTLLGSVSFVVLVLAGLVTVLLLFASRQATLRQINASLLEIAEQLKQLRQAGGASSAQSG